MTLCRCQVATGRRKMLDGSSKPGCISYVQMLYATAHMFITASLELVFKGDDGTLGLSTILVFLASPLDPYNLGRSGSTSLTSSSFRLTISSAIPKCLVHAL